MNCRLCGKSELSLYYTQGIENQFKYYKCVNCGLVNLDLSNVNIYNNQDKYSSEYINPFDINLNKGSYETYSFIKRKINKTGCFLDIGCGNGSLLYYAREDGWKVKGIEISNFLAKKIIDTLGIDVLHVNFMDIEESKEQYDLITLRHVLEHIPNSKLLMNKLNKLLKIKGYSVLEFPNIEGISFKFKRFLNNTKLYKKKYKENYYPGHCNEFSKKSFSYLASVTGFKILYWETYSKSIFGKYFNKLFNVGTKTRTLIQKIEEREY